MNSTIELKHVGPKPHVRALLEEMVHRLEERLASGTSEAVSLHVLFEENSVHGLYRASLRCHVPGRILVAHEEQRNAGSAIRLAFDELARQLQKQKALVRRQRLRRRRVSTSRNRPLGRAPSEDVEAPAGLSQTEEQP